MSAIALIVPTVNSTISGQLVLQNGGNFVGLTATLTGLAPNTTHGFHIHVYGDASDPKGLNMGGHFNPTNASHGCPAASDNNGAVVVSTAYHFGDLGSVTSDATGAVSKSWVASHLSLVNAKELGFVLGRGVIVHAVADDCTTQPTGNSGARLAQGVIAVQGANTVDATTIPDAASTDPQAIAVLNNGKLSSTVVATKKNPSDALSLAFNVTGASVATAYKLVQTTYNPGKDGSADDCSTGVVGTFVTDAQGSFSGTFQTKATSVKSILGLTYAIATDNCKGDAYVVYGAIGVKSPPSPPPSTASTTSTPVAVPTSSASADPLTATKNLNSASIKNAASSLFGLFVSIFALM
ncbi:hypothetical protein HDU79_009048 [Rhizoclosmatium sp. JEL0117]|nr:hypothetical protein HDU79_009048 [Rhizoclosmatium sp. JEL0117]